MRTAPSPFPRKSRALQSRRSARAFAAFALAFGLAFLALPLAQAQAQYGTITGTVTDPSGEVVPGARVVLTNQATSETRATSTDRAGLFSFTTVPQGTYAVTVTTHGFKTLHKANIVLTAGAQIGIPGLKLALGSSSQTIEVSGTAYYVVPTTTGAKEETITNQQIESMPLEGRSVVSSVLILPGVVNNATPGVTPVTGFNGNNGGVGSFMVNGSRSDEVAITNNGTNNIDPGCNCGAAAIPDKEMVSEVTVQTSNFSAANPQGPVVINTVTKSGTSQYHGEAYWTGRRPGWNANDWLNNQAGLARPNATFNYYGAQLGGPITIPGTGFNKHHDKAFFFVGGEWMRQTQDLGVHDGSVPTALMRQGNYSELLNGGPYQQYWTSSFTNQADIAPCTSSDAMSYTLANGASVGCGGPGIINFGPAGSATAIDPGALAFFKQMPLPNHTPTAAIPFNYVSDAVSPENHDTIATRVDYDFSENTKLYVDYQYDSDYAVDPYGLWWGGSSIPYPGTETAQQHNNQISATLVQVLSPTITNEVNAGVTRLVLPWGLADPSLDSTKSLGYPYQGVFPNTTGLMPSLTAWDNAVPTLINGEGSTVPTTFADKWLNQIKDDMSIVAGSHLIKFGVYFQHVSNQQPTSDPRGFPQLSRWGAQSANVYGDLELGNITGFGQSNALLLPMLAYNELDGYFEDNWRTSPRLTLTYGVRVDHMGMPYDQRGNVADFSVGNYINGGGYVCQETGQFGCGQPGTALTANGVTAPACGTNASGGYNKCNITIPGGMSAYAGGTAPVGAYPGLLRASLNPGTPLSGFPQRNVLFAPNVGFAYDLTGHSSSILRGGLGVYYYRTEFNLVGAAEADPPVASTVSLGGSGLYLSNLNSSFLPDCNLPSAISNGACITGVTGLDATDTRVPVTVNYSLTWSQKLPMQTVLEASYVGNFSKNQVLPGGTGNGGFNFDTIPQGTELAMWAATCKAEGYASAATCNPTEPSQLGGDQAFRPYADYSSIDYIYHALTQNYNSLQVTATRTTPHLMYSFAYTFSKALGESGEFNSAGFPVDPFDFRGRSYGPLPYDHTNVFAAQYNIVLPNFGQRWFGGNFVAGEALDGWQLTGITTFQQGSPLIDANSGAGAGESITINPVSGAFGDYNADFITGTPDTTVHPILVPGCNPAANLQANQVFNPGCFESPTPGVNGDYQMPYIHGPGLVDTDLGLFKSFAIGKSEVRKLQVRVEAFNVFNHPDGILAVNGSQTNTTKLYYDGYLQTPDITKTGNPQAGNLIDWTGHREMSLSLKFIF